MLLWKSVEDEFAWEGSWRDVCVPDASLQSWHLTVSAIPTAGFVSCFDGASEFPEDVAQVLGRARDDGALWSVSAGRVGLNCHFFDESEIEFDLDPREVKGQSDFDSLLHFMQVVAKATAHCALLTPENMHDTPFIRVSPSGTLEHISTGGFFRQMADARAKVAGDEKPESTPTERRATKQRFRGGGDRR
jgi:hypothetical protein